MEHCPCLARVPEHEAWLNAVLMPVLDPDLKTIVTAPFAADGFRRIGVLQAELRRLGW